MQQWLLWLYLFQLMQILVMMNLQYITTIVQSIYTWKVNVAMEPLAAVVLVLNQLQTVKFGSKLIVPIVDTKRVYTSKIFVLSVYYEYPEKPLSE